MAYEFDALGNVIGEYESEEERKRRLDAEQANTPVKQTITTNPDGTQEMTIKGTPQALSPMNPNTPTISGPVSPDDTFKRMQQIESGNRDFDAQGRPIQSPAGAMYRNQVMPATAANPGYGIRPAQNQSPEEYNRVGQEYYQAMLKKFGGDKAAAAAAYNAGPGRVERNMQANQGQMNVGQLPRETQGYLQKLGNVVGSVIPSAQAATPESFAQDVANRRSQTQIVPGLNARDDLMLRQPPTAAVSPAQAMAQPLPDNIINDQVAAYEAKQPLNLPEDPYQQYLKLQDNPRDMLNFAYDENNPENLRKHVKGRASELLAQEAGMARAQTEVQNMDENAVARALREKTTGGSYVKAILFGLLGMERSAMAEAAKLGIGNETMAMLNNEPVMVKVAANGTPISGINAKTGKALTAEELIAATQASQVIKGTEVEAGTYMDPTGKVPGNWVLERRPGGSVYRQVGTNAIATPEQANALRKTGVGGTLADQRAKIIQEAQIKAVGKTWEQAQEILKPYNQLLVGQGFAPMQSSDLGLQGPNYGGGAPAATGNAPAPTGVATGNAPATAATGGVATGAPAGNAPTTAATAGPRPTQGQLEADKKTNLAVAEAVGTDLGKVKATQPQVESQADQLLTQVGNLFKIGGGKAFKDAVGFKGAGLGFGLFEKPVAGTKEADFISAFNQIKGETFRQAFESLRGGGQITEREGAAATDALNRMQLSQSEEEFKAAAKEFNDNVMRMIDIRREKLGLPPKYNLPPMSETEKKKEAKQVGTKENPIEIKF